MIPIRFIAADLRRWDEASADALVVPIFSDVRPLRGAAGLVDWRMCGLLSKQIVRGRVAGDELEALLIPADKRLPVHKIFVIGIGSREGFNVDRLDDYFDHVFDTLAAVRSRSAMLVIPHEELTSEEIMERLLSCDHRGVDELVLVEEAESQRAMLAVIDREKRRASAFR